MGGMKLDSVPDVKYSHFTNFCLIVQLLYSISLFFFFFSRLLTELYKLDHKFNYVLKIYLCPLDKFYFILLMNSLFEY